MAFSSRRWAMVMPRWAQQLTSCCAFSNILMTWVQIAKALLDHEQQRSCSLPIVNLTMRNEQVAKLLVVLHWRLCSPGTGHDPNIGAKPSIQQLAGSGSSSHPLPDQAQSSQCCMTTASPANSSCQVALNHLCPVRRKLRVLFSRL